GGSKRPWSRLASQLPHGHSRPRRLQLPQSAIDRVARAAGRHDRTQLFAGRAGFEGRSEATDGVKHAGNVISQIVDAAPLTSAFQIAVVKGGHDDGRTGENMPRDSTRLV